jgi:hypothetical protein
LRPFNLRAASLRGAFTKKIRPKTHQSSAEIQNGLAKQRQSPFGGAWLASGALLAQLPPRGEKLVLLLGRAHYHMPANHRMNR